MEVYVSKSTLKGEMDAYPSKSWAIRYIILSSISDGDSEIINVPISDDVKASIELISSLGNYYEFRDDALIVKKDMEVKFTKNTIYLGGSGTTLRLGLALLSVYNNEVVIDGDESLKRRPIKELIDALRSLGAIIVNDSLPLKIKGGLIGGEVKLRGDISSQFFSSLAIAGCISKKGIEVEVLTPMVSESYLMLTIHLLKEAGCNVYYDGKRLISMPSKIRGIRAKVPGDFALSSFVAGATSINGEVVIIKNLYKPFEWPGDHDVVQILKDMGLAIEFKVDSVIVRGPNKPRSIRVNLKDAPDLVPVIAGLASFSHSESLIYGISHLKYKESDRLFTVSKSLTDLGAKVKILNGEMIIIGGQLNDGIKLDCMKDHRIGMMIGMIGTSLNNGLTISNAECVNKSYPRYWEDLIKLGANIKVNA
jgi:3-phosphoshikimate 1-carboxyvinyltransferase